LDPDNSNPWLTNSCHLKEIAETWIFLWSRFCDNSCQEVDQCHVIQILHCWSWGSLQRASLYPICHVSKELADPQVSLPCHSCVWMAIDRNCCPVQEGTDPKITSYLQIICKTEIPCEKKQDRWTNTKRFLNHSIPDIWNGRWSSRPLSSDPVANVVISKSRGEFNLQDRSGNEKQSDSKRVIFVNQTFSELKTLIKVNCSSLTFSLLI
jgi:hypothetical protein